ncbi:MAG: hypothetical protein RLZZ301_1316 [Bacteroidota bacterium]
MSWKFSIDPLTSHVVAIGTIEAGWHLYSTQTDPSAGPIPTELKLTKAACFKQTGPAIEKSMATSHYDPNFESTVYTFELTYRAECPVKIKKSGSISGEVTYMICDDTKCLPPISVPFTLEIQKP